jgi:hypothetical protein
MSQDISWIFLRSRLPRKKVNALSYQPTSPIPSDVDCGVVATYQMHQFASNLPGRVVWMGLIARGGSCRCLPGVCLWKCGGGRGCAITVAAMVGSCSLDLHFRINMHLPVTSDVYPRIFVNGLFVHIMC